MKKELPPLFSPRFFFLAVFLSGASALVYQVAWHRYLAILLGSHARATTVVLAVFMGGLGAGYALFGDKSAKLSRPLIVLYAYVEIALGLFALSFPYAFKAAMAAVPRIDALLGVGGIATDVLASALLIGPSAVLMGATLPLLTQGLGYEDEDASLLHARIYGLNTLGAAFGALACGYLLLPVLGAAASVRLGALINFAIGLAILRRTAHAGERADYAIEDIRWSSARAPDLSRLDSSKRRIVLVGALSGFYVLTLETILIRLTGLSAGSSAYHYSLIVSIFIFALGLSPLLLRGIRKLGPGHLFAAQAAATFLLLLVFLSGDSWPYAAHRIRIVFRDDPQNYHLYQALLGGALGAFLILPIGVCGLTLPLCFHLLKEDRETLGENAGLLYGGNTLGAVLGCLLGGYAFLYLLDLDTLFKLLIAVCGLSAVAVPLPEGFDVRKRAAGLLLTALSVCAALAAPRYDKDRFIQPFRNTTPTPASFRGPRAFGEHLSRKVRHVFYEDGPNTSVGVTSFVQDGAEVSRSLLVNGKSDGNTRGDLLTISMLGHLPALLARSPQRVCVIGLGTGITAGALAAYGQVREIEIVEISPVVARIAGMFDAYNGGLSKNPKAVFKIMDAFRYLQGTQRVFDAVVSEPSNPWVQGVENLYSEEFYRIARAKLSTDGLFVQWIHVYSFNDELFRCVLRTMNEVFPYVTVFQLGKGDRALIGHQAPFDARTLARLRDRFNSTPEAAASLAAAGLSDPWTVLALEEIPPVLSRALGEQGFLLGLDEPYLSRRAAAAFFADQFSNPGELRRGHPGYYKAVNESLLARFPSPSAAERASMRKAFCEHPISALPRSCFEAVLHETASGGEKLLTAAELGKVDKKTLATARLFSAQDSSRPGRTSLDEIDAMLRLFALNESPIARLPLGGLRARLDACLASGSGMLHGECLARLLILAAMTDAPEEIRARLGGLYEEWFASLPKDAKGYARYKSLKDDMSERSLMRLLREILQAGGGRTGET